MSQTSSDKPDFFYSRQNLPFCTHEGSGLGHSVEDIRRLCPGARVEPGLAIRGTGVRTAEPALRAWCGR